MLMSFRNLALVLFLLQFVTWFACDRVEKGEGEGEGEDEDEVDEAVANAIYVGESCELAYSDRSGSDITIAIANGPEQECYVNRRGVTTGCLSATNSGTSTETTRYCTCRCRDGQGNDHNTLDSLCKCPDGTVCEYIYGSGASDDALKDIVGSYCVVEQGLTEK